MKKRLSGRKLGQILERVTGDSKNRPLVHRLCAEAPVKANRRFVPVKYPPFEPSAPPFDRKPGEV